MTLFINLLQVPSIYVDCRYAEKLFHLNIISQKFLHLLAFKFTNRMIYLFILNDFNL